MKNIYSQVVLLSILFSLTSCGPNLYIPNAINSPLFEKKGDLKVAAGLRPSKGPIFDFQGALAVTDHWAVMANGNVQPNASSNTAPTTDRRRYGELGIGFFRYISNDPPENFAYRFEVFAGAGRGYAESPETLYDERFSQYEGNYQRYFLQPFIGFASDQTKMSFGLRLAHINLSSWRYRAPSDNRWIDNDPIFFGTIEPAFCMSSGWKRIRFFVQIKSVLPLYNEQYYFDVSDGAKNLFAFIIGTQFVIE